MGKLSGWLYIALLATTVILGLLVRMWLIDDSPRGVLIDEAYIGYTAYTLWETGRDDHGNSWPIVLKSFGDYKAPLYTYMVVPFVSLMGPSIFTTRLVSVLSGIIFAISLFFIGQRLFRDKVNSWFMLILGLFIPWSILLSRLALESHLGLALLSLGAVGFVNLLNKPSNKWIAITGISWGLTWYAYTAFRPVVVGILILMILLFRKRVELRNNLLKVFAMLLLVIFPLLLPGVASTNQARFSQISSLGDPIVPVIIDEQRSFCSELIPWPLCYASFNKAIHFGHMFLSRFMNSFSVSYLAVHNQTPWDVYTIDRFSALNPLVYLMFLVGLGAMLIGNNSISRINTPTKTFILLGLILSPIPSILVGEPQIVRMSSLLLFLSITAGAGFYSVWNHIGKWKYAFLIAVSVFHIGWFGLYYNSLIGVHFLKHDESYQGYLPDLHDYLIENESESLIVFNPFYSEPIMFYAFYSRMDPQTYQSLVVLDEPDDIGYEHAVELDRLIVYRNATPEWLDCLATEKSKPAVFITDDHGWDREPVYVGRTRNNVHRIVSVYQSTSLDSGTDCSGYSFKGSYY